MSDAPPNQQRWLDVVAYLASPRSIRSATSAGLAVLVILLALLATWIPARRAGRVDPAQARRVS